MKIVHAASEMFPYVKTGGLADAVGSLVKSLASNGHEVVVFLPGYRAVLEHPEFANAAKKLLIQVEIGDEFLQADVYEMRLAKRLSLYVVRRDEFFDRRMPYGVPGRDYDDNDRRYIFFCKSIVETLRILDFKADIVHGHDWQTGLLPLFLRVEERKIRETLALKTVFTIHNIAFQGIFPNRSFHYTNLPDEFMAIDGIEYYGQINMMKGGILFADRVTTVSPNYSQEIRSPRFGFGLEGVIESRATDLSGLVNGVDTDVWNPSTDSLLPANFSAKNLEGRAQCRAELLKRFGFSKRFSGPVYGVVCRLAEQKDIDLLLAVQSFFVENDCKLVILGKGETRYEKAVSELAAEHPDKVGISMALDEGMSHLIEAGSDFFLMPSIFEPCGLNQMYSQLYGTVPLVSRVGGLVDTVADLVADPGNGTGLVFDPTPEAFLGALEQSLELFRNKEELIAAMIRGMSRDFSWTNAARAYESLYDDLV